MIEQAVPTGRIRPVPVETIKVRAYKELRQALLEGRFRPGEPLTVRVVSAELGVGSMPVREAIQQLVTEGGLEFLPNRTVRVPSLSLAETEEIFATRLQLETYAAREAAKRICERDLQRLKDLFQTLKSALRNGSPAEALGATLEFDLALCSAVGSLILNELLERLRLRIGPLLVRPYQAAPALRKSFLATVELRKELLAALGRRGARAAEATMREILKGEIQWHREHSF